MTTNPVVWFEIYVQDMPRARKFYESVFEMGMAELNATGIEMMSFPMQMDRPGASGALVKMDGVASGGNSTLIYFSCADCAMEQARVTRFGGTIHKEKMSIGEHGFISLVIDTEGNKFGLHSLK